MTVPNYTTSAKPKLHGCADEERPKLLDGTVPLLYGDRERTQQAVSTPVLRVSYQSPDSLLNIIQTERFVEKRIIN